MTSGGKRAAYSRTQQAQAMIVPRTDTQARGMQAAQEERVTPTYEHTQPGTLMRWALGTSIVCLVALRTAMGMPLSAPADAIVGSVLLALVAALALMHSLTVVVDDRSVTARCGPGLIRRTVALSEVRAAGIVRKGWYYGWGLRVTPRGPLWRVSGLDAVELDLGRARWLIGTDDPEGLLAAMKGARASQPPPE
jgi:hypothetical protein